MKYLLFLTLIFNLFFSVNAKNYEINLDKNYLSEISFQNDDGTFNAFIEIPSGTNKKWEINKNGKNLQVEFNNGSPRSINYLSYPGNYGFIPQTLSSFDEGGDGDALDVLVIGESLKISSVVKIEIIGMLSIKDKGRIDNKILAVLSNSKFSEQISSLENFKKNYPGLLDIIEIWFRNYKGQKIETFGFLNKKITKEFILNANKNFKKYDK